MIFGRFRELGKGLVYLPEIPILLITGNNLFWAFFVAFLGSFILFILDRHLQRFWLIVAVWAGACLLADLIINGLPVELSVGFAFEGISDTAGGLVVAGIVKWIFTLVHPWRRSQRTTGPKRAQPQAKGAVATTDPSTDNHFMFGAKNIVTGYVGLCLTLLFWVYAIIAPIFLIPFPLLELLTFKFMPLFIFLLVGWGEILGVSYVALWGLPFPINVLSAFSVYFGILAILRIAINAVLSFWRKTCIAFVILGFVAATPIYALIIVYFPHALLSHTAFSLSFGFWLGIAGFIYGASRQQSVRAMKGKAVSPVRLRAVWALRLFRLLRTYLPQKVYQPLETWFNTARSPTKTLERIVNITDLREQRQKLWELAKASLALTILSALPMFWYLNTRMKEAPFRIATYLLIMIGVVFGGVLYHFVYRLCHRPSRLRTTLAIYTVLQLIFMPAISLLSIPALYQHYRAVEAIREQHPKISDLAKKILFLLFSPDTTGALPGIISVAFWIVGVGMQVMFVEAYSQAYAVPRNRSYSPAILAGFVASFMLAFTTRPAQDFLVYLAG
jgi:hypothetical protein